MYLTKTHAPFAGFTAAAGEFFKAQYAAFKAYRAAKRDRATLSRLSDQTLRDIGCDHLRSYDAAAAQKTMIVRW